MLIVFVVLKVILIYLAADLATGIFHFYVDNYGKMDSKYLTVSINGLLIHHDFPRKMVNQSYWDLTKGVYKIGSLIFILSLFFGFHWEILLFILISAQSNIIHKWSHQTESETSMIVRTLQKLNIVQNQKQHLNHHNGQYDGYFCVMTNLLNPFLKKIYFWESVIKFLENFGVNPVRNNV